MAAGCIIGISSCELTFVLWSQLRWERRRRLDLPFFCGFMCGFHRDSDLFQTKENGEPGRGDCWMNCVCSDQQEGLLYFSSSKRSKVQNREKGKRKRREEIERDKTLKDRMKKSRWTRLGPGRGLKKVRANKKSLFRKRRVRKQPKPFLSCPNKNPPPSVLCFEIPGVISLVGGWFYMMMMMMMMEGKDRRSCETLKLDRSTTTNTPRSEQQKKIQSAYKSLGLRWFDNHTMMWRSMQAKYLSSVGKRQFIRISVLPWRYAIYRTLNYIGFENDVVTSFADLPFSIHCK